ncbi:MAG: HD domain-containing protein [Gammaproteobacteria bacterium]|nr:HD domain-containing protein [Gammaproteobacteria bacterium]
MSIPLSRRFEEALVYANQLHAKQIRKGSGTPYVSHLLAVTSLVIEAGGDEDTAIAALLHDGPEDQGGRETLALIRERFGDRVADIVAACSDTFENPKPPWEERKRAYLAHLPHATPDTLLVSCADKLHNARAILRDYRDCGDQLWHRFNGGKQGTLWYYRELVEQFGRATVPPILLNELALVVDEIEALVES